MKKVLVTGAGGLLGAHLVPVLQREGMEVIVASRDLLDLSRPLDSSSLPAEVDAVIYLAQSSRFREFPDAAEDIFQVNTAQALALLDYARAAGATNFVYASTGGVYAPSDEPLNESSTLQSPMAFYPASKRAAEILIEAFASFMKIVVLRYFFIYGRGQKREMLIPRLVDNVLNGRAVTLQGEEGLRLNPVHAMDAACATAAAVGLDRSAIVNVAGPETLSIRAMCEIIGSKLGRAPVFEVQPDQKPGHFIADTERMSALLGAPSRCFEDGIVELLPN